MFRVFGLPRSGTAWVANWMTTDRTHCWHDPCERAGPPQIDAWGHAIALLDKTPGVSCTGSWRHRLWRCEAPTIKLIRPLCEIQDSLERVGLPLLTEDMIADFSELDFPEYTLDQLMLPGVAGEVWRYLVPEVEHNASRHQMLTRLNVQVTHEEIGRIRCACAANIQR